MRTYGNCDMKKLEMFSCYNSAGSSLHVSFPVRISTSFNIILSASIIIAVSTQVKILLPQTEVSLTHNLHKVTWELYKLQTAS